MGAFVFPIHTPELELEIRMPPPQQSAPSNPGASSTSKSGPKAPTSDKSAKALKGGGKAKEKKSTLTESASEPTPKKGSSAKSSATSLPVDPSKEWMEILGCGVLRQAIIESGLFRCTPFVYCYSIAFLLCVSVFYIKLEIINYLIHFACGLFYLCVKFQ